MYQMVYRKNMTVENFAWKKRRTVKNHTVKILYDKNNAGVNNLNKVNKTKSLMGRIVSLFISQCFEIYYFIFRTTKL